MRRNIRQLRLEASFVTVQVIHQRKPSLLLTAPVCNVTAEVPACRAVAGGHSWPCIGGEDKPDDLPALQTPLRADP